MKESNTVRPFLTDTVSSLLFSTSKLMTSFTPLGTLFGGSEMTSHVYDG